MQKPPTAPKSAQSALGASQSLSGTTPAAVASPTAASGAAKPNFELSMKDPHAEPIPSPERRRITRVSSSMPATGEWAEMSEHNRKNFNLFEETEKELKKETQKRIKCV